MIRDSCAASPRWTAAHWSRGVAVRPVRQKSLSSSITGRLVISPRRTARADLPAAPGPVIITLFTFDYDADFAKSLRPADPICWMAWDADGGGFAGAARRHAQVHVFALLAHTDKATVDPLDLDQRVFYVLPTAVLDGRTRSQHSITLKTLQGLTAVAGFGGLRQAVQLAAESAGPS